MKTNLALRRSRRRHESAGAAMFVVAVTLGLLAAMGVYGLAATAQDVRAAGHVREATQAQHAAEAAIVMASQTLNSGNAANTINTMMSENSANSARATNCKSAKPFSAAGYDQSLGRIAEACFVISPNEMKVLSPNNTWSTVTGQISGFTAESFGEVPVKPYVSIELTNPVTWQAPGYGGNGTPQQFLQVRATVYSEMKNAVGDVPQSVSVGRGRLVIGPF